MKYRDFNLRKERELKVKYKDFEGTVEELIALKLKEIEEKENNDSCIFVQFSH